MTYLKFVIYSIQPNFVEVNMETLADALVLIIVVPYLALGFDGMLSDLGLYHLGEDGCLHWGPSN